ncbi:UNVERIFIED_CONTAM: hypothetical protein PYX00_004361 [Menopon gallinae]|uniref:Uncharacterized protein n=1 Tax=Menopon gallinae TaxID=328185 RepID=A0AAW2I503_9NEOP
MFGSAIFSPFPNGVRCEAFTMSLRSFKSSACTFSQFMLFRELPEMIVTRDILFDGSEFRIVFSLVFFVSGYGRLDFPLQGAEIHFKRLICKFGIEINPNGVRCRGNGHDLRPRRSWHQIPFPIFSRRNVCDQEQRSKII